MKTDDPKATGFCLSVDYAANCGIYVAESDIAPRLAADAAPRFGLY
jgi:hypothetical protein